MTSDWKATQLSQDKGLHPNRVASVLLSSREIENLDSFISPSFKNMLDPETISGCVEVAKYFSEAVKNKWNVAVIGDYDVDGVVSASMLKMFFKAFDVPCHVFLPHRIEQGYGLNPKTMDTFLSECDFKPHMVIAADCGTSSEEEIAKLKKSGTPIVIVIDHHKANEGMFSKSADVVMNWRFGGDETCTAGQIFHLARYYAKKHIPKGSRMPESLSAFLPMAAIAIVADVMPITSSNRIIVRNGLKRMKTAPIGMVALAEKCGMTDDGAISQKDVAFRMAPRINASGRIDSPVGSYALIMEDDEDLAENHVEELNKWNKSRQIIQKDISKEAIAQAKESGFKNGILVYNKNWHVGVVGIVASRLVDEFGVPAIVIGESEGKRKGSARSVQGVSVKTVMDSCSKIFDGYGGHDMAAGCSLKEEFYVSAAAEFDAACLKWYEEHGRPDFDKNYDMELEVSDLTNITATALKETLYPYCDVTNPEPIFVVKDVSIVGTNVRNGDTWKLTSFKCCKNGRESGLKFTTFSDDFDKLLDKDPVSIYFSFGQNTSGNWPPDLEIVDIIPSKKE